MRGQENSDFNVVNTKDDQLTTTRLSSVPKRNTNEFLLTYVQNQRRFLKHYLSNEMTTATPNHQEQGSPICKIRPPAKSKSQANVFETPVLKARVPIVDNVITKKPSKALSINSREKVLPSVQEKKAEQNPALNITTKKRKISVDLNETISKNSKERDHTENTEMDDEDTQRREERRIRKKAKKNIMQTSGQEKTTSSSKQKSSKMAPTGFALMHGFCATNVGKNRLTLDPIRRDVGFFKKGKASSAATTGAKFLKTADIQFSEVKFLKGRKREREPSDTSSRTYTSSAGSEKEASLESCKGNESLNNNSSTIISAVRQTATEKVARIRPPYNPANSIVWDIETDVELNLQGADSEALQGSITVKMPRNLKTTSENVNDGKPMHSAVLLSSPSVGVSPDLLWGQSSSLSLGPSESASQVARAIIHPTPITDSASKYFNYRDKPGELAFKDNIVFVEEEQRAILSDDLQLSGPGSYEPRELGVAVQYVPDSVCRREGTSRKCVGIGRIAPQYQDTYANNLVVFDSETGSTVIAGAGDWLPLDACNSDELGSLYEDFRDQFYEVGGYQGSKYGDCGLRTAEVTESSVGLNNNYDDDLDLSSLLSDDGAHAQSATYYCNDLVPTQGDDTLTWGDDCYHTNVLDRCKQDTSYSDPGVRSEIDCMQETGLDSGEQMLDSGRYDFDLDSEMSDIEEDYWHDREFCQGRRLLLFGFNSSAGDTPGITRLRDVEVEVAVGLKTKHWLPQRLGV